MSVWGGVTAARRECVSVGRGGVVSGVSCPPAPMTVSLPAARESAWREFVNVCLSTLVSGCANITLCELWSCDWTFSPSLPVISLSVFPFSSLSSHSLPSPLPSSPCRCGLFNIPHQSSLGNFGLHHIWCVVCFETTPFLVYSSTE